ncbi:MAG: hypothetical protein RL217_370 [Pseudomonadota bacterium]|jgi:predicted Kef-type K+ transport protein
MLLAGIYLVAALLGGIGARLVHLPPLLGFLVAGFALSALGVSSHPMVEVLANLGVTLMLFGVGLQINIGELAKREVWFTAMAQSALMVVLGVGFFATLAALGVGMMAGSHIESWAMLALALSFSSTVFVIKILEERGDARSRYGQIAIGVLVMQDLIAVIFLAATTGASPSMWSLTLFLLVPARKLIIPVLERLGHGEMVVLLAVFLAMDPGYILFESVGLKGDLGAVAMGMLFASHPKSHELSRSIFALKELLLVAFFLSIGLSGLPTWPQVGLGLLLLVLLFAQSLFYFFLVSVAHMRRRTAVLTALVMANNSEFALIIATTLIGAGLLDAGWLTTLSVAVAASFVLGTFINMKAADFANAIEKRWPDVDVERLAPNERPVHLGDTDTLVLGMGRVGRACYLRLVESHCKVMGVEHDDDKADEMIKEGLHILHGDATDADLWRRVRASASLTKVVLALPYHDANLDALRILRGRGFSGRVVAVSHWQAQAQELIANGADDALHLYSGAGGALADAVLGHKDPAQV